MPLTDAEISSGDSAMDVSSDADALNTEMESEETSQPDQNECHNPGIDLPPPRHGW
jgi:hypothetical protein